MADSDLRRERTRLTTSEVQLMLLLVIGGVTLGVVAGLLTSSYYPEMSKLFWGAAVTLLYGSLLGGVVALLIADFDRRRAQRAAQMDFIANVLSDLKAVYDRVDRARTLIKARRSAKTYGEEMLNLIEARVTLKNVDRALRTDERKEKIVKVLGEVEFMDSYLRGLLNEYEEHYKDVSLSQSIFEAQMKKALEPPPADSSTAALPRNAPWERIEALDRIKDFLTLAAADGKIAGLYAENFLRPLDRASESLRAALADELKQSR
jgi:small basic protein